MIKKLSIKYDLRVLWPHDTFLKCSTSMRPNVIQHEAQCGPMWSNRVQLGQIWHNLAQPDAVISDCIQAHIVFTSKKIHSGQKIFLMRNLNFDNFCVIFFSTWILWKVLRISFETQINLKKTSNENEIKKVSVQRHIFFPAFSKLTL